MLTYVRYLAGGDGDAASALKMWADVAASDDFWQYLAGRARTAADPRLTSGVVDQIRSDFPSAVLEPVARRAAALIDEGELHAAAELIRAVRRAGLNAEASDAAARLAIAPIRAKIEDGATTVEKLIGAIPSSEGATPAVRQRLEEAEHVLIKRVLSVVVRLKQVDPVFNDEALGDRAAAATRRLSVAACNHLDDWTWGYVLIRMALETARSPTYLAQLAGDQAQVCASYHHAEATEEGAKHPALAAAHIELAIPYARDEEEREEWTHLALGIRHAEDLRDDAIGARKREIAAALERREATLRARVNEAAMPESDAADEPDAPVNLTWRATESTPVSRPEGRPRRWRRWLVGGAVVAAIIVGVALSQREPASPDATGGGQDAAGTPAASLAPAPIEEAPLPLLDPACDELTALEDELDRVDQQIAEKRDLRDRLEVEMTPIIAELDQIDRDYPGNELPPDVWDRYVPLRDEYNTLAAKVKRAGRDTNTLIRAYNAKVGPYNDLRKKC